MQSASQLHVLFAAVMGVAVIGFVSGTSGNDLADEVDGSGTGETTGMQADGLDGGVAAAKSYAELRQSPRGSGSGWEEDLASLRAAGPGVLDPVSFEGSSKAEDIAARASRRAYDGAPPRVPHSVRQDSAPECLACHEEGLRFRGLLATPMSHTSYMSCTQCHVVTEAPMPGGADLPPDPRAVGNTFSGLSSLESGPRAWAIAPPRIPHRTFMRETCDSCHGVNGRAALRSSHPARENCQQCHASSAERELRPGVSP